ncbi:hypothetical protein SLW70_14630 [Flavobacterium sp. NG2]|uniref:hypothetical protein n=1 Tax=Flavobacterium sp. NG2 TaxID=3097547 RepID=UPI002A82DF9E|nr:hypothetical protein [Flavobacterium sp. NG2]WPR71161.1 hypothetical protein SLW70_14630 [Flavobacterium sp. NG2]
METNKNKTNLGNQNGTLIAPCTRVSVTDLRIGNLLEYYPEGENLEWQYFFIDWYDIKLCEEENESFNNDSRPIPITEELLLKIGAIKLDYKDFPSYNLFGTQINSVNGLWFDFTTKIELKGLHHLQNIFFFRNSEELQISALTEY